MKRLIFYCCGIFIFCGCSTVVLPNYIPDNHPYTYKIYAGFDEVRDAAFASLSGFGWVIDGEVDPAIYERSAALTSGPVKQTLILTKPRIKKTSVGLQSEQVNILLRTLRDSAIEVEFRFVKVTSIPFKKFYSYQEEQSIRKIFEDIQKRINSSS